MMKTILALSLTLGFGAAAALADEPADHKGHHPDAPPPAAAPPAAPSPQGDASKAPQCPMMSGHAGAMPMSGDHDGMGMKMQGMDKKDGADGQATMACMAGPQTPKPDSQPEQPHAGHHNE